MFLSNNVPKIVFLVPKVCCSLYGVRLGCGLGWFVSPKFSLCDGFGWVRLKKLDPRTTLTCLTNPFQSVVYVKTSSPSQAVWAHRPALICVFIALSCETCMDTGLLHRVVVCLFASLQLSPVPRYTAWWQRHMGTINLPKVVTRQRGGRDSKSRPLSYYSPMP